MGYKEDVTIDIYDLHHELEKQAVFVVTYGDSYADAVAHRDRLKDRLGIRTAKIGRDVRLNPATHELARVTDSAIGEIVTLNEKIKNLNKQLIEANKEVNYLFTAKNAFGERGRALLELSKQLLAGLYSAKTYIPEDLAEENSKETKKKIRRALQKKSKEKNNGK